MKRFITSWLINTLAVLVACYVVTGITYQKPLDLFVASLVLGILNSFIRPVLMVLTFPLLLFTLGLFRLVINALLLYFVGSILQPHFKVDGFWAAFWGALLLSVISSVLHVLTGTSPSKITVQHRRRPPDSGAGGNGPVIDI
ncbi:MAG TPA: phage holin family protein [Candidatus Acidoferrum sp.]|nr:phage holin family protein [Candidatus Acidoferrum sp.]